MEKNNDLVIAKELFACWDTKRLGHITVEELAEQLISFGLSASKQQVVKLLQAITVRKGVVSTNIQEVTLKAFLKIFERDIFGDKVVSSIKEDWLEGRRKAVEKLIAKSIRTKSKGGLSDSDLMSLKSQSIISQSSKRSMYTSMYGKWGTTASKGGFSMKQMEIKPTIQE